ncbi:MAG: hypothetical protein AAGI07_05650, partial [Bacteroidota bacterium]
NDVLFYDPNYHCVMHKKKSTYFTTESGLYWNVIEDNENLILQVGPDGGGINFFETFFIEKISKKGIEVKTWNKFEKAEITFNKVKPITKDESDSIFNLITTKTWRVTQTEIITPKGVTQTGDSLSMLDLGILVNWDRVDTTKVVKKNDLLSGKVLYDLKTDYTFEIKNNNISVKKGTWNISKNGNIIVLKGSIKQDFSEAYIIPDTYLYLEKINEESLTLVKNEQLYIWEDDFDIELTRQVWK